MGKWDNLLKATGFRDDDTSIEGWADLDNPGEKNRGTAKSEPSFMDKALIATGFKNPDTEAAAPEAAEAQNPTINAAPKQVEKSKGKFRRWVHSALVAGGFRDDDEVMSSPFSNTMQPSSPAQVLKVDDQVDDDEVDDDQVDDDEVDDDEEKIEVNEKIKLHEISGSNYIKITAGPGYKEAYEFLVKTDPQEPEKIVLYDNQTGEPMMRLSEGQDIVVGRNTFSHLSDKVSGDHFRVTLHKNRKVTVEDLDSTNGTDSETTKKSLHDINSFNFGPLFPKSEARQKLARDQEGSIESKTKRYTAHTMKAGGVEKGYATNGDSVLIMPAQKGLIMAADGMGGGALNRHHDCSGCVVEAAEDYWNAPASKIIEVAGNRMMSEGLYKYEKRDGTKEPGSNGSTMAMMRLQHDTQKPGAYLFEAVTVADSKAYVFSQDHSGDWYIKSASKDQSLGQDCADSGLFEKRAMYNPKNLNPKVARREFGSNNIVTNGITCNGTNKAPEREMIPHKKGDIALVVTDGVSDSMTDEDLLALVQQYGYSLTAEKISQVAYDKQIRSYQNGYYEGMIDGKLERIDKKEVDNIGVAMAIC